MVYSGPARGCQRCKDRHVKCDLRRPICRQCARLKFNCPGYGHDLDVILRNQTAASVVSRNRHRDERRQKKPRSSAHAVPNGLTQSVELRALTFLFTSSSIMSKKDSRSSHGHLDFLQPLYDGVASDSALALVTTWFAVLVLGFCDKGSSSTCRYYPEMDRLMSLAIRSISNALASPRDSITNETLTAVILLAHGEYLQYKKQQLFTKSDPKTRMLVHQEGAEALIKKRDMLNFQDSTSIALFDAVRHNAVGLAFAGVRSMDSNWALYNDDEEVRQLCDSYTFATELDACCLLMLYSKNDMAREDVNTYAKLQTDLSSLLECLRCWSHSLPKEWFLGLPPKIKSLDICYLFNDWYLLQLAVRHLLKELRLKTIGPGSYASDFSDELDVIDNIMASEYLFISTEQQCITSDPRATDERNQGRRLFGQTVERLELIISDALQRLILPHTITLCYQNVLCWARKGR